jgi:hypothetical protein
MCTNSQPLRLVSNNPHPIRRGRLDGPSLRGLADRLMQHLTAGCVGFAHALVTNANLNPMDTAIIATRMARAGHSEAQILAVMAGVSEQRCFSRARRSLPAVG